MKKTLLITLDFAPSHGGVAKYYKNICKFFPKGQLVVFANKFGDYKKFDKAQNYKIIRKRFYSILPIWPRWIPMLNQAMKIVRQDRIKMIHVGQVLPVGTVAYFIKKMFGIPYMVYTHGLDIMLPQKKPRKKKLMQKVLQNAEFVVANSEFTEKILKDLGVEVKKIKIVYPGVDIEDDIKEKEVSDFKEKYSLKDKKIILSLSRLVERKGYQDMISAMPKILEKYPDCVYIIAGNGKYAKQLNNMIGLDSRVCPPVCPTTKNKNIIFIDEVDEHLKKILLKSCDIFTMPCFVKDEYDVEGFGIVYLEAGVFGKPSIAGASGGAPEAVLDKITGLLIEPRNVDDIASKTLHLLKDQLYANKLGANARKRVLSNFQWEKQVIRLLELI